MLSPVVRVSRALLRQAARTPIESIVVVAIVATLAYFSLLLAISRSHWVDSLAASAALPLRRPAAAAVAPPAVWERSAAGWALANPSSSTPTAVRPVLWIDAIAPPGQSQGQDPASNLLQLAQSFADRFDSVSSLARPYALPGQPAVVAWTPAFASPDSPQETELLQQLAALFNASLPSDSLHIAPALAPATWARAGRMVPTPFPAAAVADVDSVRLVAYASRALFSRFGQLLRSADSADIFVMLCVYIFMHATFVNLFISMRRFRSNFWLGASVLTSCTCAFLFALTSAHYLGVSIDPVALSEALPFLVVTVGFDKHYKLTKAVFSHPAFAPSSHLHDGPSVLLDVLKPPARSAANGDAVTGVNGTATEPPASSEDAFVRALTARLRENHNLEWEMPRPLTARDVLAGAYDTVSHEIIRDYVIELALLLAGACVAPSGLRQFCQLAALILFFDGILLHTFYTGILTVLVEVLRIRIMRNRRHSSITTSSDAAKAAASADGTAARGSNSASTSGSVTPTGKDNDTNATSSRMPSISITPTAVPAPPAAGPNVQPHHRHRHHTRSRGVRGLWHRLIGPSAKKNPVGRLKILLIASFITLHSLNLVGTLTTQASRTRYLQTRKSAYTSSAPSSSALEENGPYERLLLATRLNVPLTPNSLALAPALEQFARSHPAGVQVQIFDPVLLSMFDSSVTSYPSEEYAELAQASAEAYAELTPSALSTQLAADYASNPTDAQRGSSSSSLLSSRQSLDVLGSLMSQWTSIVGDPIISKWLSIAMVVSIFLNAYLLKGIAQGNAAIARGNAMGAAAFAAARMLGAHLDEAESRMANSSRQAPDTASTTATVTATTTAGAPPEATLVLPPSVPTVVREKPVLAPTAAVDAAPIQIRSYEEVLEVYDNGAGVLSLVDEEVVLLGQKGKIPAYALEKVLQDPERAVRVRRALVSRASLTQTLESSKLPYENYNYAQVLGACCENVVGYLPLPLGIAGPLTIDGKVTPIPMATTEGTLVASTSRGCKALNAGGGVTTVLTQDAMTRGPVVDFPTAAEAALAKRWVDSAEGASTIKAAFDSTSRFARLASLRTALAGRTMFIRFATSTGDAMGMNMISKGVERALELMAREHFPSMKVLALSGNYCTDKKPAAINWIEGRGKSVVAESVVPHKVVTSVLKTTVPALVDLNTKKNLIGSAMAGSIGGFNAHAANILTAIYLATGQDPAQNVESSNCMTLMEATPEGDLRISVSMPSIEVGTVGGGTVLDPQRAMLELLGIAGPHPTTPGANAQRLAAIIAAAVMAGELSLMSALAAGHLIKAHMAHNRSAPPSNAATPGSVSPNPHSQGRIAATLTPLVAPSIHLTPTV